MFSNLEQLICKMMTPYIRTEWDDDEIKGVILHCVITVNIRLKLHEYIRFRSTLIKTL